MCQLKNNNVYFRPFCELLNKSGLAFCFAAILSSFLSCGFVQKVGMKRVGRVWLESEWPVPILWAVLLERRQAGIIADFFAGLKK